MALGFALYGVVDVGAKVMTEAIHPLAIAWARQLGFFFLALLWLARRGRKILRSARPNLQILRAIAAVGSATLFIFAVKFVPLADTVAVTFVAPFFVTLLAALILGESVGPRRLLAVAIGFAGAMIVIRPGMGVLHPAATLAILAALLFALRQVLSRIIGATDSTETTMTWNAIVGGTILTIPLPFVWSWPEPAFLLILAGMAVLAAAGEFVIIRALEIAEAVVLAPVHYTMIIWGVLWGYLVFGDLPDIWTWVGTAIIVASGLYTFSRERRVVTRSV